MTQFNFGITPQVLVLLFTPRVSAGGTGPARQIKTPTGRPTGQPDRAKQHWQQLQPERQSHMRLRTATDSSFSSRNNWSELETTESWSVENLFTWQRTKYGTLLRILIDRKYNVLSKRSVARMTVLALTWIREQEKKQWPQCRLMIDSGDITLVEIKTLSCLKPSMYPAQIARCKNPNPPQWCQVIQTEQSAVCGGFLSLSGYKPLLGRNGKCEKKRNITFIISCQFQTGLKILKTLFDLYVFFKNLYSRGIHIVCVLWLDVCEKHYLIDFYRDESTLSDKVPKWKSDFVRLQQWKV